MKNLILDMDGTLAELVNAERYLDGNQKELFYNLRAYPIVDVVHELTKIYSDRIYILSACNTQEGIDGKLDWLEDNLPLLDRDNVIFCSTDTPKSKFFVDRGIENFVLVDDYSLNINDWQAQNGKAIKAFNGMNCKNVPTARVLNVLDANTCHRILTEILNN